MLIKRKSKIEVMKQNKQGEVDYLTFPDLEGTGIVNHLFSTRLGGVSEGYLGTMNLSYGRGDKKENVDANYRKIAQILGTQIENFVLTDQTHTVNIKMVGKKDAGKGIIKEKDYCDIDGFITNEKGLVLTALFADCVPLYFVDPLHQAIGLAHAGWKGTVRKMAQHMLSEMEAAYGSKPEDMKVGIGPCICRECYEVGEEVLLEYRKLLGSMIDNGTIYHQNKNGKYQLDIALANYYILLAAGVRPENISTSDICTCCNPEYLYSHRASDGKRGNLGAFLALK